MRRLLGLSLLVLGLGLLAACESDTEIDPDAELPDYTETGDLDAIGDRGYLRILVHRAAEDYLPRDGDPLGLEREMLASFAREQGLEPAFVAVDDYGELLNALNEGRGDVVAANMTVTAERRERALFTQGIDRTREQVVGRSGAQSLSGPSDLSGERLGVMRETAFEPVAQELEEQYPGIELVWLEDRLTSDEVLDGLGDAYDYVLQDSNVINITRRYRDDIEVQFDVGDYRPVGWALRESSPSLHRELDRFITREGLTRLEVAEHTDDLDGIRERGVLRVLTRNNAASYYLWRGELVGFEYEMAQRLARELGVRLQMVVAPRQRDLIPMLKAGEGDLIAAFMTRSETREERGVRFSRPYHYATETVVGGRRAAPMDTVLDLAGREIHVRPGSSYRLTLDALREQGIDLRIGEVPPELETESILGRVASGDYELTVADSHLLELERNWSEHLQGLLELGEPVAHGWAVREGNPQLLEAVNNFWNRQYRSTDYNILYQRYFLDEGRVRAHREERVDVLNGGRLSPYDELVREAAEEYNFDWRLLVSLMFQESEFNPEARSWIGARGLMQVMPRTAREFGVAPEQLEDPEINIPLGARYLNWTRDRWPERLSASDRVWFALAAYNAGVGHVRDARRLAAQQGLDPDRWFGNVEEAMLLLSRPEYHRNARHGYVRGTEPVNYVRNIRDRYRAYVRLVD